MKIQEILNKRREEIKKELSPKFYPHSAWLEGGEKAFNETLDQAILKSIKEVIREVAQTSWKGNFNCDCNMCYAYDKCRDNILSKLSEMGVELDEN